MKKGLTEVVFILDRSGSMSGLESDTIGGFNSMLKKQKKEAGQAYISTILFDDSCEVLHDRVPVNQVEPINENQYYVRGCTALLDAVGGAIKHIINVHKYAREEDRPEKTVFIITTDGMENSSRKYSYEKIKKMIEKEQKKYGWKFIFIGANIDSIAEAGRFGIKASRAVNYVHDNKGTEMVYTAMSNAISAVRCAPAACMASAMDDSDWAEEINRDYAKRRKSLPF